MCQFNSFCFFLFHSMDMEKNLGKNPILRIISSFCLVCGNTGKHFRVMKQTFTNHFQLTMVWGFFSQCCPLICHYRSTQKMKYTCLPSPKVYQKCLLKTCRASTSTALSQTSSTILLTGTSALDETTHHFEGCRGSLRQKRNTDTGFSRFRLVT